MPVGEKRDDAWDGGAREKEGTWRCMPNVPGGAASEDPLKVDPRFLCARHGVPPRILIAKPQPQEEVPSLYDDGGANSSASSPSMSEHLAQ